MATSVISNQEYKAVIDQMSPEQSLAMLYSLDFPLFYRYGYAKTIENFVWGWHIEHFATRIATKKATATLGARSHAKSETLYAKINWRIFNLPQQSFEMFYISANETLAAYHVEKARLAYMELTQLGFFQDYQLISDSRMSIQLRHRPTRHVFTCRPLGVESKMRGLHADEVICDDLMGSEQLTNQRISLTEIEQVKQTFFNNIHQIPRWPQGAQLHVTGNATDPEDIIFKLRESDGFDWESYPAIKDGTPPGYEDGRPLWPEMYTMESLQAIRRRITDMPFERQYMCIPARRTQAFLSEDEIDPSLIQEDLDEYVAKLTGTSYAMIDIGKVRHPSHITVLTADEQGILWQRDLSGVIGSSFLRNVEYMDQVNFCKLLIDKFNIAKFYYDATRGEFDAFQEEGRLPSQMEPIHFNNVQNQWKIAHSLRYSIRNKIEWTNPITHQKETTVRLRLLADPLQVRQLLSVDEQLDSPDRRWDHADAFWSVAGAVYAARDVKGSPGDNLEISTDDSYGPSPFGNLFESDFANLFSDAEGIWKT